MTESKRAQTEVEYDPGTDTYYGSFTPGEIDPTTAVANHLAEVKHCDPLELAPIYEAIETDALDSVLKPVKDASVRVTFTYDGFSVTVDSGGSIEIRPPESGRD